MSLAAVAEPAEMSPTYLQKLERDEVESPSPHRLYRLSEVLKVGYAELMELAGYVVPGSDSSKNAGASVLAQALSSSDVTEEEMADLAQYLKFKRDQAKQRV